MCLMVNESSECVGSIFHVGGALTDAPTADDFGATALWAPATSGAKARTNENLRII
jgi:hypothetical protein